MHIAIKIRIEFLFVASLHTLSSIVYFIIAGTTGCREVTVLIRQYLEPNP
jgi:hypothetical protein